MTRQRLVNSVLWAPSQSVTSSWWLYVDSRYSMRHQAFNSFWHGTSLSPLEWACLSSFIDCGHRFRLFSYESISVPRGVSLEDASTVVRRDDLFLLNGTASAFSNVF